MNYQYLKAIIYQDYKSVRWIFVSFLAVLVIILYIDASSAAYKPSSGSFGIVLHALWGTVIGAGIRSRDKRLRINNWLDALPVKFSAMIAVRFIFRLITVVIGSLAVFYIVMYIVGLPGRAVNRELLPFLSVAITAYCMTAVFSINAVKESQAMGIGLLALAILSVLIQLPKLISPILNLEYWPDFIRIILMMILLGIFMTIIKRLGENADLDNRRFLKRAFTPVLIGIIILIIMGGAMIAYARRLTIQDMHYNAIHFNTVIGNKEECIISGSPLFSAGKRLRYAWLVSSQEIKRLNIGTYLNVEYSPDGRYFSGFYGLYKNSGERIIRADGFWWFDRKWSPDRKYIASVEGSDFKLRLSSIESPEKKHYWESDERDRHSAYFCRVIDWLDNNTVIIIEAFGIRHEEYNYRILSVDRDLKSRVIHEIGQVHNQSSPYYIFENQVFVNPANESIVLLKETSDNSFYDLIEIYIYEDKVITHGQIGREHRYRFFADKKKALFAEFSPDESIEGNTIVQIRDLVNIKTEYFNSPGLHLSRLIKFSPDGNSIAFLNQDLGLTVLNLLWGQTSEFSQEDFVVVDNFEWTVKNKLFILTSSREDTKLYYYDVEQKSGSVVFIIAKKGE